MFRKAIMASLAVIAVASVSQAQTAIRAWELNGNFNDTLGNAAITGNGGSVGANLYTFAAGQGLIFPSDTTLAGDYSMETYFQFTNTSGFRRITDWLGGTSDNGYYNLSGSSVYFSGGTGNVDYADNTPAHLVITRASNNTVSFYVNGILSLALNPPQTTAVNGANTRFFQDDGAVGGENSAGSADYIRVYNSVLTQPQVTTLFNNRGNVFVVGNAPEPATLGLLALGLLALRHRRRA